jgi:alcohol dehydrogenase
MRHVVFVEPGRFEWREAPDPVLRGPGEALVRPVIVGRCDLDVIFSKGLIPIESGEPVGHEIIAEVIDIGDNVRTVRPGDMVFVPAQISCGACVACRRGLTGRCQSVPFASSFGMGREGGFGGGLADLLRVPYADAMLTPVPAGADPLPLIGLADMSTDAWRATAPHLQTHPEAQVLVLGGMPQVIGLLAAGMARALGAEHVDYVDEDAGRRQVAEAYGVRTFASIDTGTYDLIVVANPSSEAIETAFARAAPGATVNSVIPAFDGAPDINTRALYHKGITWKIGRPDCRHGRDGALTAWARCGFCADKVRPFVAKWENAAEAWSDDALYVVADRR